MNKVLRGNFRREGKELPNTPDAEVLSLEGVVLKNKTGRPFSRVFHDSSRGELYFVSGQDVYSARYFEKDGELVLRDKRKVAYGKHVQKKNERTTAMFIVRKDGLSLQFEYFHKEPTSGASLYDRRRRMPYAVLDAVRYDNT